MSLDCNPTHATREWTHLSVLSSRRTNVHECITEEKALIRGEILGSSQSLFWLFLGVRVSISKILAAAGNFAQYTPREPHYRRKGS